MFRIPIITVFIYVRSPFFISSSLTLTDNAVFAMCARFLRRAVLFPHFLELL